MSSLTTHSMAAMPSIDSSRSLTKLQHALHPILCNTPASLPKEIVAIIAHYGVTTEPHPVLFAKALFELSLAASAQGSDLLSTLADGALLDYLDLSRCRLNWYYGEGNGSQSRVLVAKIVNAAFQRRFPFVKQVQLPCEGKIVPKQLSLTKPREGLELLQPQNRLIQAHQPDERALDMRETATAQNPFFEVEIEYAVSTSKAGQLTIELVESPYSETPLVNTALSRT
ncbi:MAG TPA: hypothetical protein VN457_06625 [Chlamydiales bacterium]|nr:hypothetical protein [Chlamydiales bacterium]